MVDVCVVGAGVIGLTTAVCLAEAGHRVRIRTESLPAETTSAVASGLWVPGLGERDLAWSRVSHVEFCRLASTPGTGVHVEPGLVVSNLFPEPPAWVDDLPEYRLCEPAELPAGMLVGWWTVAPMIDLKPYLRYLTARLAGAGVEIERGSVRDLATEAWKGPVVVNCTGVAAGRLAGDPGVVPVRGQHVVVRNPGIGHFYVEAVDSSEWTGFFPHGDRLVLAGTSQRGNWELEPDPAVARGIRSRCAAVDARIGAAEVLGHEVGLRPARAAVRFEVERAGRSRIVHSYGHGGEGVSLSWGCARAVVDLLAV